jgi:hypothetical protein
MNAMDTWLVVAIVAGGAAFMLGAWLVDRRRNGHLRELYVSGIDRESEHIERDRILLELLDVLAPEVATLVRDREDKVGYWYA